MATTTNQLSWEAFEQLPDDGMHHELIEGELITSPPPKSKHSEVAKRAFVALLAIEKRSSLRAYQEAGYKLSRDPASWIQPDVSFLAAQRAASADPEGYFLGAPELAVEVISPSESPVDVERKVELFLSHGGQIVWVIYPKTRTVRMFLADGSASLHGLNDSLALSGILPGWSFPVAMLFETE